MTDYAILAPPRIRAATFARILRDAGSPAAASAAASYAAIVAAGVDPALELAVFQHESTYGRAGIAKVNRSWGNLRRSPSYPTVSGFVRYPTWQAGAADCARLLAVYGRNQIRPGTKTSTAQTFPFVWAPTADGNAPDRYGDAIVAAITRYVAVDRALTPPVMLWGAEVPASIRVLDPSGRKVAAAIRKTGASFGTVINIVDLATAIKRAGGNDWGRVDPIDVTWLLTWAGRHT